MNKFILAFAAVLATIGNARAELTLETGNPPGSPLLVDAGTTSGTMFLSVVSDNPPNDVMAAWNVSLQITGDPGSTGTVTFHAPDTGLAPIPTNYVFGGNGLGIAAVNSGETLAANDFFDPALGPGVSVPGTPGANLLGMDFTASADAKGLFGIYAVEGAQSTQWTDDNFTTRFFTNVPNGRSLVRIGEIFVPYSVPEPSSLVLLALGAGLAGWRRCRRVATR